MAIDQKYIKAQALERTQALLLATPNFGALGLSDQKDVFRRTYNDELRSLAHEMGLSNGNGTAVALAKGKKKGKKGKTGGASDLIDEDRHQNQSLDKAGERAGDFMDEVDFPGFVRDLLKAVFDANLEVTLAQMEAYQKLLKAASGSISEFVKKVGDEGAFGYLAENNSDEFGLSFGGDDDDDDAGGGGGGNQMKLVDKDGEPVDMGDNQVKAKIMDAKIAMAKEQRKLLRETILMGITRLVVTKGQVKASVLFDIKASEKISKADKAAKKNSSSSGTSVSASGGLIGSIFGGPKAGHTSSRRKTQISISSAKSQQNTDLAAKVTGFVDIQFKSDYFALDNFKDVMLAEIDAEKPAGAAPAAPKAAK